MDAGWTATGLLKAHWGRVGGRDKLAELTGINRVLLSAYNTGNTRLGWRNAEKIARELGITVQDLGAPGTQAEPSISERLEALQRDLEQRTLPEPLVNLARLEENLVEIARQLKAISGGVDELRRTQPSSGQPSQRTRRARGERA